MYLSFDDVLLQPQYGRVDHRSEVNLDTSLSGVVLKVPIVSAAMSSVTETMMARAMDNEGTFGVIHRFMSIDDQVSMYRNIKTLRPDTKTFCAIGIREGLERVNRLMEVGCGNFCLDVANAYQKSVFDFLDTLPFTIRLIVGNVATSGAVTELGTFPNVDTVKVGIGPGAACITREVTGVGVPQLSAIMDCYDACKQYGLSMLADGGIRNSGDIVKSLVAGADAVMVGYLLAGSVEAPLPGVYYGMASSAVEEYNTSTPEGVSGTVASTGPVSDTIKSLADGIRSGISYLGGRSIKDIKGRHDLFLQVTTSSLAESRARV